MDLLNLGSQSRKTGIRPRQNLRKDKYDMEDVDEFFSDDDDDDEGIEINKNEGGNTNSISNAIIARSGGSKRRSIQSLTPKGSFNNVAKRLNFDSQGESFNLSPISITSKFATTTTSSASAVKQKNKKSPLRSPLPEHKKENAKPVEKQRLFVPPEDADEPDDDNYYNDNFMGDDDGEPPDMSLSPVSLSPITKRGTSTKKTNKASGISARSASSLTKRMALGKASRSKKKSVIEQDEEEEEEEEEDQEVSQIQDDDGEDDEDDEDEETRSELLSPPPTNKKPSRKPRSTIRKSIQRSPAQQPTIIKPSPLPSPPPDGLRRSKRVKVAPLAYWRNERIVYSRADETQADPDTTLATDIRKVPLQIIKEIVQMPEPQNEIRQHKRSRSRSRTTPPKQKKSNPNQPVYDYESDPEITGSEWFSKKSLDVNVYENDKSIKRTVVYAPDGGTFKHESNGFENFDVASLFQDESGSSASGLVEFPLEGSKEFRSSGTFIYYFHVVRGLIEVTLNNSTFVVTRGCSFQVPPQNSYGFKNIGQDSARLFFVQSQSAEVEIDNGEDNNVGEDDESWE